MPVGASGLSASSCDPAGVVGWEACLLKTLLRSGNVVGDAAVDEEAFLVIVESVTGTVIVVAGLADAADIDRVAFLGIELDGLRVWLEATTGVLVFFPDRGDVRVTVEADERGLRGKVGFGVRVVGDVVELRGFVEGSMGERNGVDMSCEGLIAEPGFLGFGELFVGELEGLPDRDVPIRF